MVVGKDKPARPLTSVTAKISRTGGGFFAPAFPIKVELSRKVERRTKEGKYWFYIG